MVWIKSECLSSGVNGWIRSKRMEKGVNGWIKSKWIDVGSEWFGSGVKGWRKE